MPKNSTIVRSSDFRPNIGLRLLGALSHVAPGAAARLAERRYLTPPRFPAPEREREVLARGRPGALRVDGRRIATWAWGAGPAILLVHGWGGRGAQLGPFVAPLVARGFSVVTFDGPAHGASDGDRTSVPELARTLDAVLEASAPVRGIVAHSGGGAVTLWALRERLLAGHVDLPGALALIAPVSDLAGHFERFVRQAALTSRATTRLRARLAARIGLPLEALDVRRIAADLPLPALVVHDRHDREVPWAEGAAIARPWDDAELVTTEGLGHRRILRDPAVVARVVTFLAARLETRSGWTPAGAGAAAVLC